MSKLKQISKSVWSFLSGKKTYIGLGLHVAWFLTNLVFKDFSTPDQANTGHMLIGTITGTGVFHKAVKNKEKINNAMKRKKID